MGDQYPTSNGESMRKVTVFKNDGVDFIEIEDNGNGCFEINGKQCHISVTEFVVKNGTYNELWLKYPNSHIYKCGYDCETGKPLFKVVSYVAYEPDCIVKPKFELTKKVVNEKDTNPTEDLVLLGIGFIMGLILGFVL